MKIAIIGASGNIGSRITHEALSRGHKVTAIVRKPEDLTTANENLVVTEGDIMYPEDVAVKIKGHDALVVAGSSDTDQESNSLQVDETKAAITAAKLAGIKRIINVGGAGSYFVAPGGQAGDLSGFPADWRPGATEQSETLEVYRQEKELDWTYFSPARSIGPGERTGKYRVGTDNTLMNEKGENTISYEDYAVALLDELENPQFIRKRFTAGY